MPDVRVLNELQIKKNGVVATYRLGTVNGYYNSTDGKFYEEVTHVTEIEGAPNLVYADIAGNALYIYKTATSSFVKVSGSGGGSADNLKFGYLNDEDGKFYEDDQYQVEIPGNADYLFIGLDNDTIYRYDTSDTAFVSIGGGGGGTEYQAGTGIDITDGIISGNYKGGFNIKIDGDEISTKTFVGTLEEWNNLTSAQKAKFDTVSITDDGTTPIATPGHEVLDSTDTPLPQRTNIQFEGAEAIDDSTNDITKVTVTPYTAGDGIEINDHEVSVTEDRPATFVGTTQEWDALTAAEKAQYKIVNLTDDATTPVVVVDAIEDGNLNPVTSNAVYDALIDKAALIRLGCAKNKTYTITVSNKQAPILFMNQRYASTTTSNTPGLIYCFGDQRSALLTIQAFVDFSLTRKGDGTFTAQNSGNTTGALFILTTSNNKITMTEDT